jgi:hypothetical protein
MHHLHASSGHWLLWVAGGCALLLAIFSVVGTAFVVGSFVSSFATAGRTCLPSDFPQYPSASVRYVFTYTGPGIAPGDSQECQENLDANDAVSILDQFYAKKLESGDWNLTDNDAPNGHLDFKRVSRPKTVGYIQLLAGTPFPGTVSTRIEIRLDS